MSNRVQEAHKVLIIRERTLKFAVETKEAIPSNRLEEGQEWSFNISLSCSKMGHKILTSAKNRIPATNVLDR